MVEDIEINKNRMNLDFIVSAVQKAGEKAKINFEMEKYRDMDTSHPEVKEKSYKELVIEEDYLCQEILVSGIKDHDPDSNIYSEEMNNLDLLKYDTSEVKYLIDPLDGTHNFFFGLPLWGIAVAVLNYKNIPIAGVIFLPMTDLLLKCEGIGDPTMARNDATWQPVYTHHKQIQQALICYDNQFYKIGEKAVNIYETLVEDCFTTRITGSAVCDCAFIACGKINARLWNNTNSYDIAAGIRIVEGAGGNSCDFFGNAINIFSKEVIMCSNPELKQKLVEQIQSLEPESNTNLIERESDDKVYL